MEKFEFKAIDVEGEQTLEAIAAADKFNNWMFKTIEPFCKGNILEIGSGIGNISEFFITNNYSITLSDIRDNYCASLKEKFEGRSGCKAIININLTDDDFDKKHGPILGQFDTVFALNVVEHIEDDLLALRNCHKLLKSGGQVVILVPAFNTIYNRFDKELEHFRRYTKSSLSKVIERDFELIHSQYFNAMGIPGWVVSGGILKNKTLPKNQVKLYNALVPAFKLVDKALFNSIGLSVIQVGRKA